MAASGQPTKTLSFKVATSANQGLDEVDKRSKAFLSSGAMSFRLTLSTDIALALFIKRQLCCIKKHLPNAANAKAGFEIMQNN